MMELQDFHFLRPLWFLALIPAALMLFALLRRMGRHSQLEQVCDANLLAHLWLEKPGSFNHGVLYLLGAGWLLAVIALAGPVWERQPQPVYRAQVARVIVLDLSETMNVSDLTPTRLDRARFKLADILKRSGEGRTALVVFSGEAHIVTPLTSDTATIETMLPALATNIVPSIGDHAATGLKLAEDLLERAGAREGDVLLMTDGIADTAAALQAVSSLVSQGHRVSVMGVATEAGAPILGENGGFKGMAKIDVGAMQTLARSGKGAFSMLQPDDSDLDTLLLEPGNPNGLMDSMGEEGVVDRWKEMGIWLLPLLLLLASSAFRRGWLAVFLLVAVIPPPSYAMGWDDLWWRADQQGLRALNEKQPELAAEKFESSAWRGAARYQAGQYEEAVTELEGLTDEISRYNRANALARAGKLEESAAAFREILQQNPAHEDAAHNLKIVEEELEKNEQPPKDDEQQNQDNQQQPQQPDAGEGQQPPPMPEQQDEQREIPPEEQQASNSPEQDKSEQTEMQQPEPELGDPEPQQDDGDKEGEGKQPEEESALPSDPAMEQWLRQVPDDPSGLLRRKFMLEHLRRKQELQGS